MTPNTSAGIYFMVMIEDRTLYPGAYNRGEPGESDQFVWSRDRLQLARTRWLLDHRKWL